MKESDSTHSQSASAMDAPSELPAPSAGGGSRIVDSGRPLPAPTDPTLISGGAHSDAISDGGPGPLVHVSLDLVGQSLGPFELQEFIGGGGMGAVYRAVDTVLKRTVADGLDELFGAAVGHGTSPCCFFERRGGV